jgi:hypothetical protein
VDQDACECNGCGNKPYSNTGLCQRHQLGKGTCGVEGCGREVKVKKLGLCGMHAWLNFPD